MAIKQLYLGNGNYAGYISDDGGSAIMAYNNRGHYVGNYNKSSKLTYDSNGRPIQNGGIEALGMLIFANYEK